MSSPAKIKLLLFGPLREIGGADPIDFDIDEGILSEAVSQLVERFPSMSTHKLLLAVNEEYADLNTILKDGDEVAVFTPVSGG